MLFFSLISPISLEMSTKFRGDLWRDMVESDKEFDVVVAVFRSCDQESVDLLKQPQSTDSDSNTTGGSSSNNSSILMDSSTLQMMSFGLSASSTSSSTDWNPAALVRKEKLGDRITALQQLVSPFGKTDTASVLHEAIDYIRLLHEQVNILSTPYMKQGTPIQQQQQSCDYKLKDPDQPKQDLKSRGLCLVPIASTFPVANETTVADLWTPTYGGTYR
ncbi:hypothetical protein EZV62_026519 [Acer yangbiense]|uniref:BHLH domain-containing protein n=1 Tax=Acer yangbiense TaxID=1000413 RepID=A0A5C7GRN5_9ROSI|nr:hypothetical protein EZV62_026519 [Acer yangbiense]